MSSCQCYFQLQANCSHWLLQHLYSLYIHFIPHCMHSTLHSIMHSILHFTAAFPTAFPILHCPTVFHCCIPYCNPCTAFHCCIPYCIPKLHFIYFIPYWSSCSCCFHWCFTSQSLASMTRTDISGRPTGLTMHVLPTTYKYVSMCV
jgi:hypothetical protein